ncbi:MbtH family protein [Amycolatopsis sp. NPDC051128]|uniref:MbtH family protein n=1 Tax=Amycolatopsis sp. NPDC051128 TaxID=3155412 RepID=UPI00344617BD
MGTNPFEDQDGRYLVLVDEANQHSLWPAFAEVPAGWRIAAGPADRQSALGYVERNWTGLRARPPIHAREA